MGLEKYNTPINKENTELWLNQIIQSKKTKEAILQFSSSSQLNENLFFIAMYFLRNVIHKVDDLSKIFTIKEINVLCEFLKYYDETSYVFENLVNDGIFPSKDEKVGVN